MNGSHRLTTTLLRAMALLLTSAAIALPTRAGDRFETIWFRSPTLAEVRPIGVYLPPGHGNSSERYPTVYVLDGEWSQYLAAGILDTLYQDGFPKTLLVAIPNVHRTRDLTPVATAESPGGGGADAFLRFLGDEVVPFVEERYRGSGFRLLVGHSLGGLFVIHTAATRPELFEALVAISPSVFIADDEALERYASHLSAAGCRSAELFIALGDEPGDEGDGVRRLAERIARLCAPSRLRWMFRDYPLENHSTVPIPATLDGIRFVFADFKIGPKLLRGSVEDVVAHYAGMAARYRTEVKVPQRVLVELGYGQLGRGEVEAAIATFRRYVEIYPDMVLPHDALADIYSARGDKALAIAELEEVLRLYPGNPDAAAKLRELRGSNP